MSNTGVSRFVIVDASCFICAPETDEAMQQNELMVKFCMDAKQDGFHVYIMYDDYNPFNIHNSRQNAYKQAEDALYDAVESFNTIDVYDDVVIESLTERLYPYSAYQIVDPDKRIKDAKAAEQTASARDPLDKVAFIVSPECEEDYGPLFGDYGLYLSPAEIEDFEAFKELSKRLTSETTLTKNKKQRASDQGLTLLKQIQDSVTFEQAFGVDREQIFNTLAKDPVISRFLMDKPANIKTLSNSEIEYISREEFILSQYFAALVRAQTCPQKQKTHTSDATWHQNEIARIKGGLEVAKKVEAYAIQLSAPRSSL